MPQNTQTAAKKTAEDMWEELAGGDCWRQEKPVTAVSALALPSVGANLLMAGVEAAVNAPFFPRYKED